MATDLNTCSNDELRELVLGNWHQLNKVLNSLNANTVYKLIILEVGSKPRVGVLERLHKRFMELRKKELGTALGHIAIEAHNKQYTLEQVEILLKEVYVL